MNVSRNVRIGLVALCVVMLVGCRTSDERFRLRSGDEPQVWIYIPFSDGPGGYPAQIAIPPFAYNTNRIEVIVEREVVLPGKISLRPGSTVLQAVACAGGFTAFAKASKLRIIKPSGEKVPLQLHSMRFGEHDYRRVWYEPASQGPRLEAPKPTGSFPVYDYVLEEGDIVYVSGGLG